MSVEECVEKVEDVSEDNSYTAIVDKEIYRQVGHFKKVIDAMVGDELDSMDDYINFILKIGMQKMLIDVLPDDEALQMTMVAMFEDNPEYLCEFVSKVLKDGKNEKVEGKKSEWINAYG
ncbi:hypothetical protein ABOONEI_2657 [Aciduliprofundum boonei T469]|nr:hypothetical protein ABOONEI_2657 [Aciduliprofundum boonei T469]